MGLNALQGLRQAVLLLVSVGTQHQLIEGNFQPGDNLGDVRGLKQAQGRALSSILVPEWKQELEGHEEASKQDDGSKESSITSVMDRAKEMMKGAWDEASSRRWANWAANLPKSPAIVEGPTEPAPGPVVEDSDLRHKARLREHEKQKEKEKFEAEKHEDRLEAENQEKPEADKQKEKLEAEEEEEEQEGEEQQQEEEEEEEEEEEGQEEEGEEDEQEQQDVEGEEGEQEEEEEESSPTVSLRRRKAKPKHHQQASKSRRRLPKRRRSDTSSRPRARSASSRASRSETFSIHAKELAKYYRSKAPPNKALPPQFNGTMPHCTAKQDCPSPLHSCLDGVCTCPPILRGNANCTEQTPVGFNRGRCFAGLLSGPIRKAVFGKGANSTSIEFLLKNMMGENGENDLSRRQDWSTCAVVGSSGSLKSKKQGGIIDQHSAIIRFNNAPAKGYAGFAGNRTTLRVQNFDYCGAAEYEDEMCMSYTMNKQCTHTLAKSKLMSTRCQDDNLVTISKMFSTYVHSYWETNQPKGMLDPACQWICPKKGLKATGTVIKPTLRIPRDSDLLAAMKECKRKCNKKISSGFFGILYASHLCGKVDVYGFGSAPSKSMGYYFPKVKMVNKDGRNPPMFRHHWKFERYCIDSLRKSGIPGLAFR